MWLDVVQKGSCIDQWPCGGKNGGLLQLRRWLRTTGSLGFSPLRAGSICRTRRLAVPVKGEIDVGKNVGNLVDESNLQARVVEEHFGDSPTDSTDRQRRAENQNALEESCI